MTLPYVPPTVTAQCDHRCVGVLLSDDAGRYLMIRRNTPPIGIAPVAGHVDQHGSPMAAAIAEVREEVGLTVTELDSRISMRRPNVCRRQHGGNPGHEWTVYTGRAAGTVDAAPREVAGHSWYSLDQIQALVDRTVAYAYGEVTPDEFQADPGIEPVWVGFLADLGLVEVTNYDLALMDILAAESPYAMPAELEPYEYRDADPEAVP